MKSTKYPLTAGRKLPWTMDHGRLKVGELLNKTRRRHQKRQQQRGVAVHKQRTAQSIDFKVLVSETPGWRVIFEEQFVWIAHTSWFLIWSQTLEWRNLITFNFSHSDWAEVALTVCDPVLKIYKHQYTKGKSKKSKHHYLILHTHIKALRFSPVEIQICL